MARHLNLHIPAPCTQSWEAMERKGGGRHCLSCQKTVVDFTTMTDGELVAFFRSYEGGACGRFDGEQLDRALLPPRRPLPGLRYFFTIALPAFLLSVKALAAPALRAPVQMQPSRVANDSLPHVERKIVQGTVRDDAGNPIPYATVCERGTKNMVSADANGDFSITIPLPGSLAISATGFESKTITARSQSVLAQLSPQFLMGDVYVVSFSARQLRAARRKARAARKKAAE